MKQLDCTTFSEEVGNLKPRHCFAQMHEFLKKCQNEDALRQTNLMEIFGLKNTGKTTLLKQLVALSDIPADEWLFIETDEEDTVEDLEKLILNIRYNEIRFIVIDQITKVKNFLSHFVILYDALDMCGKHVLISGDETLLIEFANMERFHLIGGLSINVGKIRTTYMSFPEYCYLYGSNNFDEYLRYGGLMYDQNIGPFVTGIESCKEYVREAVAANIHESVLEIDDINDNGLRLKYLSEYEIFVLAEKSIEERFYPMHIYSKEYEPEKIEWSRVLIRQYLREADAVSAFPGKFYVLSESDAMEEHKREMYLIQPALRFFHHMQIVASVGRSGISDNWTQEYIDACIFKNLTKQAVLSDTDHFLNHKISVAYKIYFAHGENQDFYKTVDMLIHDRDRNQYRIFKITHASDATQIADEQQLNARETDLLNKEFGTQDGAYVLYNGKTTKSATGTICLNISDFLLALDKYKDVDKVMEALTADLQSS